MKLSDALKQLSDTPRRQSRWPTVAERPSFDQYLLLSILLHALAVVLLGDTNGDGIKLGNRLWGATAFNFNATLPSALSGETSAVKLPRRTDSRMAVNEKSAPAIPANAAPVLEFGAIAPVPLASPEPLPAVLPVVEAASAVTNDIAPTVEKIVTAPITSILPSVVPVTEVPRMIAHDVVIPVTSFVVAKPAPEQAAMPPLPMPLPPPVLRALSPSIVPTTSLNAPALPALPASLPTLPAQIFSPPPRLSIPPAPVVIAVPIAKLERLAPRPPKLAIVPTIVPPAIPLTTALPPVVMPIIADTVVPLKIEQKVEAKIEPKMAIKPPEVKPPELKLQETKAAEIKLPEIRITPVLSASPVLVESASVPATPIASSTALPRAPEVILPAEAKLPVGNNVPGTDAVAKRDGAPASGSTDASKSAPKLDLDTLRNRARAIASQGSGPRTLLPFPVAPPVALKKKEQEIFDQALKRPDCKDAYAAMGLAAVVPLLRDAVTEKGCKW